MKGGPKAGAARREAIIRAAVELFAKKGFHAASTAEVAKLAGVSEGIVFYHFQTKEGILVHLLNSVMEDYLRDLAQALREAATGLVAIERYVDFHFERIKANAKLILLVVRDFPASLATGRSPQAKHVRAQVAAMHELVVQCLRQGQEDGTIRPCPLEETAHILRGLLNGATRLKLLGLASDQDLAGETKEFCRRALSPST